MGTDSDPEDSADPAPVCELTRDSAAIIRSVDAGVVDVLGWQPEDLVGRPTTEFIHPEDQPAAVAAWFDMLGEAGSVKVFRGRYRAADGSWRWLEVINENRLEDPDDPIVVTRLVPVTVHEVTVEEELRARKQMLALLADALPVGVFQFDTSLQIAFANDQLHALLGKDSYATLEAAFRCLDAPDAEHFERAVGAVLSGEVVDALELRSSTESGLRCVFEMSLRPLTAADGTISGAIGCISDVTERVLMRRALEREAAYDPLTQCFNRAAILARLDAVLVAMHEPDGVAVLFVDLDDFKSVNDEFGHAAGDAVLVGVAERLGSALRHGDMLGRLGGDEFLLVCPAVEHAGAAQQIADRIEAALRSTATINGRTVTVAATVGVAWTGAPMPRDVLIGEADHNMYVRKRDKRSAARADGERSAV